jgi:chromosome segregation ATPase
MSEVEDFANGVQGDLISEHQVGKGFQGVIQTLYLLRDQVRGGLGREEEVTHLKEQLRVLQADFKEVAEEKQTVEEHSMHREEELSRLQKEVVGADALRLELEEVRGQQQSLQEKQEAAEKNRKNAIAAKAEELQGQMEATEALQLELEEVHGQQQSLQEKLEAAEKNRRNAIAAKAEELQGQKEATEAL